MDSHRVDVLRKLDPFVTIKNACARSLRSAKLGSELGHYVATKLGSSSALRSYRALRVVGRYVATEQYACSVAM